jgi:type II secretory pathway component PulF
MKTYVYTAKDSTGRSISSQIEAGNPKAVIAALHREGLCITRLMEQRTATAPAFLAHLIKTDLRDLARTTRQFALLLNAGLTPAEALDTLQEQTQTPSLRVTLRRVLRAVQSGETLACALSRYPRTFSKVCTSMVRAGETGGALGATLARLACFYEKELVLRRTIQGALVYPAIVAGLTSAMTLFLMLFIVPQYSMLYSQMSGGEAMLPALTRRLFQCSCWLAHDWWALLLALPLFAAWAGFRDSAGGHALLDPLILRLPVIGPLGRRRAIVRFTRTLGTLLQSGVPLLEALEAAQQTAQNAVLQRAITIAHREVQAGETLTSVLFCNRIFPRLLGNLVGTGEVSGNLEQMLLKLASVYEWELDSTLHALISLVQPALIAAIGLAVGFILIALYLPIFNFVDVIK